MTEKKTNSLCEDQEDLSSIKTLKRTKVDTSEESQEMKTKFPKSRRSYVTEYERRSTKISNEDESDPESDPEESEFSDEEDEDEVEVEDESDSDSEAEQCLVDMYLPSVSQKVVLFGLGVAIGYIAFKYIPI